MGMVAGLALAQLLTVQSVNAQPRQWRECFASSVWDISGRNLNAGQLPQLVNIPPGWTPVGGLTLGQGNYAGVVLCR